MKIKVTVAAPTPENKYAQKDVEISVEQLEKLIGERILDVALVAQHGNYELTAEILEEESGCASVCVDGKTADGKLFYLAAVESPGEYCEDSFTSRLYAGNPEYETDGPIALVKSKADGKRPDCTPYSDSEPLTKIVYIDRQFAVARVWEDLTESLTEHVEDSYK